MYLFYVDESGDIGLPPSSPSPWFVLSGLVLHELVWRRTLDAIVDMRRQLRSRYGFKLREELHAAHLLHTPGDAARIPKSLRLRMLRDVLDFQATLPDISVVNVVVDKRTKPAGYDVFEMAWKCLVQRFHDTISFQNFPGPKNPQDYGLLVVDKTDEVRLRLLTRRMRRYNPIPNRNSGGFRHVLLTTLVEDAVHRDSNHSYLLQLADVNAFFLYQKHAPMKYMRRKGGHNYFDRLDPVLCRVASPRHPQGIVVL